MELRNEKSYNAGDYFQIYPTRPMELDYLSLIARLKTDLTF